MNINKIKKEIVNSNFIQDVIYFKEITSTNDYAKDNIFKDTTLIIADMQTNGRGKGDNVWYTNKSENAIMTIVMMPRCDVLKLEGLTMNIALSIKEIFLRKYNIKLDEKYPNDLLLNNKKICGILTEVISMRNIVNKLIIGIGFNVNQINMNDKIKDMATSLKIETKKNFLVEDIICDICNSFKNILQDL